MNNTLAIGKAYYRVTYADPLLTIPAVQPMIFLGTNIFDDDPADEAIYYFQDAGEWLRYGNALQLSEENSGKTGVLSESNPNEIHELENVIRLLETSLKRGQLGTETN